MQILQNITKDQTKKLTENTDTIKSEITDRLEKHKGKSKKKSVNKTQPNVKLQMILTKFTINQASTKFPHHELSAKFLN